MERSAPADQRVVARARVALLIGAALSTGLAVATLTMGLTQLAGPAEPAPPGTGASEVGEALAGVALVAAAAGLLGLAASILGGYRDLRATRARTLPAASAPGTTRREPARGGSRMRSTLVAAALGLASVTLGASMSTALPPPAISAAASCDRDLDPQAAEPADPAAPPADGPIAIAPTALVPGVSESQTPPTAPSAPRPPSPTWGTGADTVIAEAEILPVQPRPVRAEVDPPTAPAPVVVQRGDTLWSIAQRHLNQAGDPLADSAAAIDAEWRRWYLANLDVIGANPDLILPGQILDPPEKGKP